jgi:hypothetical protein
MLWSAGESAQAQSRVALVVGNSNYRQVSSLPNPVHDSQDVAAALDRLNFKVTSIQDADFATFRRALSDFNRVAPSADIAVIYFAGHGIEVDGENWLLPTDTELHSDVDASNEAINLKSTMLAVGSARMLGLVILDACRNNPFESTMQRAAATRGITRGLAPVDPFENVLVAYAARDGTIANDGTGRNSPFTAALLRNIETPGLEIDFLFRNVRDEVRAATKDEQQPFVYGSLSSEQIYLKPPVASLAKTVEPEDAAEIAWSFLKATGDIATLARFADRFPRSPHVAESRVRIASLQALPIASTDDPGAVYKLTNYVQAADASFEDVEIAVAKRFMRNNAAIEEAWNFVKDTTDHKLIRRFVEQFPTKKRRIDAEMRVAALGQAPIVRAGVSRRPLPKVEPDEYIKAARDSAVIECYTLGNQNDPSCRLAVERYPEISRFPESLEFIQNFCVAIGKSSGCVSTVKSDWNFPAVNRSSPTSANSVGSVVTGPTGSSSNDPTATPTATEDIKVPKVTADIKVPKVRPDIKVPKVTADIKVKFAHHTSGISGFKLNKPLSSGAISGVNSTSVNTSAVKPTSAATTTLHATADLKTTRITTDVKTPHVTTEVKLPKVTQNAPSVKVPSVTPTVHTPTVNVKVNVRVPNVQVHLPH